MVGDNASDDEMNVKARCRQQRQGLADVEVVGARERLRNDGLVITEPVEMQQRSPFPI